MKTIILNTLLVLCSVLVLAQENKNYKISLAAKCGLCVLEKSKEFKIDLTRKNDKITIVYSALDSIQTLKFKKDDEFKDIMNRFEKKENINSLIQTKVLQLKEKYSVYFIDSLKINIESYPDLFNSVDLLGTKNERFTKEMMPKEDIFLDPNHFYITIQNQDNLITEYIVEVLNESRFPVTYKLIESLLDIYRTKKPGTLLDRGEKTLYY
jgi:hypothetical protein